MHSTSGIAGGYQLGAGANLPPLLLDDDEAVAVAVGLRTAASGSVRGIEEASVRALLKLEQVLPSRLRHRVAALHSFIVPLSSHGPTVEVERLSAIAGACRDHHGVRFQYHNRTGVPSERSVEPHRLVHTGLRWYLVAWDVVRKDWRTFRLDRIEGGLKTSTHFNPRQPPEGDFAIFVSKSLAQMPYPFRARITLQAAVETLATRIPPSAGMLEAIDDHSCLLHAGYHSMEGIAFHLSWLGVDFKVHEPPELIDYLRILSGRLMRAAEQ